MWSWVKACGLDARELAWASFRSHSRFIAFKQAPEAFKKWMKGSHVRMMSHMQVTDFYREALTEAGLPNQFLIGDTDKAAMGTHLILDSLRDDPDGIDEWTALKTANGVLFAFRSESDCRTAQTLFNA